MRQKIYETADLLSPVSSDLPCKGGFSITRAALNQDTRTSPCRHLLPGDHHHHGGEDEVDHGDKHHHVSGDEDNHGDVGDDDANACCHERSP